MWAMCLNSSCPACRRTFENGTQELPERIFSVGEDENGEIYLIAGPDPRQAFNPNRPSVIIRLAPKSVRRSEWR